MDTVIARLDHVIAEVADIRTTHASLIERRYPEAWPIGPFWPSALTSGIAVGGLNLELYQPLDREPSTPPIRTLVFEPVSLDAVARAIDELGLAYEIRDKIESDPELLRRRGFTGEQPERICTNLVPVEPPFPFFFCSYSPFLRERLAPAAFAVRQPVEKIIYGMPASARAVAMRLGMDVAPLEFVESDAVGVFDMKPWLL